MTVIEYQYRNAISIARGILMRPAQMATILSIIRAFALPSGLASPVNSQRTPWRVPAVPHRITSSPSSMAMLIDAPPAPIASTTASPRQIEGFLALV
jgi:hypothetical protein